MGYVRIDEAAERPLGFFQRRGCVVPAKPRVSLKPPAPMAIMMSAALKPSQVSCVRCGAVANDSEDTMEIGNGSERSVLVAKS